MSYPETTALEALDDLDEYRVIDVREEYEFHGPLGFIDCAELVPLSTVEESVVMLGSLKPLLLVCRSGMRSGKVCEMLQDLGTHDVANLSGGMIGWNRAGLPVSHTDPQSLTAVYSLYSFGGPALSCRGVDQAAFRHS